MTQSLDASVLRARPLPQPGAHSDKEQRGRVLVIGSSRRVPGAALLSGTAALRAGAGKLQLAVPQSLATAIGTAMPESGVIGLAETRQGDPVFHPQLASAVAQADCILMGPGLMAEYQAYDIARRVLEAKVNAGVILDAAALHRAPAMKVALAKYKGRVVLTPHAGEMASLLGIDKEQVEAEPERIARDTARELGCVIALKGATTFIADPGGAVWRNDHGSVGLGTSGSGDVLAGIIAGLAARGASILDATLWGVFVHA
ncbi:MAG: NAD(P)H-hydrate dehydratase, partial [Alphaproteobacteria bacterium]|nr:NAD(P)H-hydrate dehydratase [Alphaproteobacteria bacterium]